MNERVIANRYQMAVLLGSGGMGTVYRGTDLQTDQPVAIKHLQPQVANAEMIERFRREGEALRLLNHPNIVKILDTAEDDGQHYLVMEYIAGGDLSERITQGALPLNDILRLAIDLADALTRAHKLEIVHRDLKPANVLIDANGVLRLSDFGMAHFQNQTPVTGKHNILGTYSYLPPEVFDNHQIDARADIWAFGVILFEMLTGKHPFASENLTMIIMGILTAPLPDLEALAPHAPIPLIDLVYRMLQRDPKDRIPSVRYIGAELEDLLQGRARRNRFDTPPKELHPRPRHNVPAQTTPFVGRDLELSELDHLFRDPYTRLVTVVAPGGMGKTRLAFEAAARQIPHFEHGVYVVELAPLTGSESIIPAVALSLGYQLQSDGREAKQQIADFLYSKDLLLMLDNFEHLLDGAGLVNDLLQAAPRLKILTTSRQRLEQPAETLFHLTGMDFPTWETPDDALEYAAVQLFLNSAKRAKHDFELTKEHLEAVARICRLVQGMPLGIVLAASWLGMLSPQEIAAELQHGLDILESDSQHVTERQRSMRAVMDYSWQQMSTAEQAVFAKLAVFRGGFDREAATAVAGATLRQLMSLVNKSLLQRDSVTGRFTVHELLRQYAAEHADQQASRDAHSRYFAQWMQARAADLKGSRDREAVREIQTEYENVKAAWLWSVEQKYLNQIEQSLEALSIFLRIKGKIEESRSLIEGALEIKDPPRLYIKLLRVYIDLFTDHLAFEALEQLLHTALQIAQAHEEPLEQGILLGSRALVLSRYPQRMDEAVQLSEKSITLISGSNEAFYLAHGYQMHAVVLRNARRDHTQFLEKSYATFVNLSNSYGQEMLLNNLAVLQEQIGNYERALELHTTLLDLGKLNQSASAIYYACYNLSDMNMVMGDYMLGLSFAEQASRAAEESGILAVTIAACLIQAAALTHLGRFDAAHEQIAIAYRSLEQLPYDSLGYVLKYCNIKLEEAVIAYNEGKYQLGITLLEERVDLLNKYNLHIALEYLWFALLQLRLGDWQVAKHNLIRVIHPLQRYIGGVMRVLYGFACVLREEGSLARATEYAALVAEHQATDHQFRGYAQELLNVLRDELPAEDFQAAYERGKGLDVQAIVAQLLAENDDTPDSQPLGSIF